MNCPRFAPSFTPFENRGRREDRVRAAPAVSCANCAKNAHTSIQVQRRASGLPCAMVLRRTSCSSRCANSFSHRYPRIDGWSWPGWARASSADVTPATGARTTRLGRTRHALRQVSTGLVPSRRSLTQGALASVVGVPSLRSRSPKGARPATTFARPTLPRPPHPAPRLVTIAKRPSVRDGIPEVVWVIWGKREADYFCGRRVF
jgi:hypothetical protein